MSAQTHVEKLRTLCQQWGASLLGVADLRSFNKEEILLPPSTIDSLPFAVSVGYHLSDAIMDGVQDQPTPLYFQHYQRINILLDTIGLIVNTAIQSLGYQSIPIPASQLVDWQNQRGHLSHKHVAKVRAGDKRIILVDGEAMGAINRVPAAGEARSNMHAGGKPVPTKLTRREEEICGMIGPSLRERG